MALRHEEISGAVLGATFDAHRELGPGLLESVYEECLCYELGMRNLATQRQVALPIRYKDVLLECGYRLDIVVKNLIVLEMKCVAALTPLHDAQLPTYLRISGKPVGLLINFNVPILKDGIRRMVL